MPLFPFPHQFDPLRYARAYLLAGQDEAKVQEDTLQGLARVGVMAWSSDAGAKAARGMALATMKRLGLPERVSREVAAALVGSLEEGFSDISGILAPGGRGLYLEVKRPAMLDLTGKVLRPAGRPEPEQLAFLDAMHRRGAVVGVVWGLSDALDILSPHLPFQRGLRRGA